MTPFRPDTAPAGHGAPRRPTMAAKSRDPRFSPQDGLNPERPAITPPAPSRPDTAPAGHGAPRRPRVTATARAPWFSPRNGLTPEGPR